MSKETLERVLTGLMDLTPEERGQVYNALRAAESLGGAKTQHVELTHSDEMWVVQTIQELMTRVGTDASGWEQLRNAQQFSAFKQKVPAVVAYINKIGKEKNKRRAFLLTGLELLFEDLKDIGIAPTSRTMMAHVHRVPAMIDRAFPGYMQSGLMYLIIKKRTK